MQLRPDAPARAGHKHQGGKHRLRRWIIAQFPPHVTYIEPFFGAGSVFFAKPRSRIEVINDRNVGIVNFYDCLRAWPEDLARAVALTPYSRYEHQRVQGADLNQMPTTKAEKLALARQFFVWANQGRGRAGISEPAGWTFNPRLSRSRTFAEDWATAPDHLLALAQRLQGVYLEYGDALSVVQRWDSEQALHYLDPPYLPATRGNRWDNCTYLHEMSAADHEAMAEVLLGCAGMFIISHYECQTYDDLYLLHGWRKLTRPVNVAGAARVEALYISPGCRQQAALF